VERSNRKDGGRQGKEDSINYNRKEIRNEVDHVEDGNEAGATEEA